MLPGARFAQWMIQTDQIIFGCTMELHGIIQEIVSHVRHSIDLYPSMHTLGRSIQSLPYVCWPGKRDFRVRYQTGGQPTEGFRRVPIKRKVAGWRLRSRQSMSNWRKKNRKETRLVLFLSLRLMLWKSLKQARHETRQWIKFPQPRPVSDTFNSFHPARPLKPFSLQTLGFSQLHPLHCCRHFPNEITHETNREQGRNWSGSSSQIVPSWQRAVRWRKKLQDCRNWKGHVWGMPLCPCLLHAATLKVKLSFWQGAAGGCPAALLRLILSA